MISLVLGLKDGPAEWAADRFWGMEVIIKVILDGDIAHRLAVEADDQHICIPPGG